MCHTWIQSPFRLQTPTDVPTPCSHCCGCSTGLIIAATLSLRQLSVVSSVKCIQTPARPTCCTDTDRNEGHQLLLILTSQPTAHCCIIFCNFGIMALEVVRTPTTRSAAAGSLQGSNTRLTAAPFHSALAHLAVCRCHTKINRTLARLEPK
jgi:hypothetical protein